MKINKILITTIVTSVMINYPTVYAQVQQHRLLRGSHIRRLQQHNNPYSHTLVEAKLAQNTPSCNKVKICLIGSGYDCAHFGGGGANQACHEDLPKAGVSGDSFDTDTGHSSPWWQDEIGSGESSCIISCIPHMLYVLTLLNFHFQALIMLVYWQLSTTEGVW